MIIIVAVSVAIGIFEACVFHEYDREEDLYVMIFFFFVAGFLAAAMSAGGWK